MVDHAGDLIDRAGVKVSVRAVVQHQIRITGIRVERLQDISDEDCLREGITTTTEEKMK